MAQQYRPHFTLDDYIGLSLHTKEKLEYYYGEILAMAGGSDKHNALTAEILRQLGNQLIQTDCVPYSSDQRVCNATDNFFFYPDITVICGKPEKRKIDKFEATLNPKIIVEVLSEGTAGYDLNTKLQSYKEIPSVDTILFVEQDEKHITLHSKIMNIWNQTISTGGNPLSLQTLNLYIEIDQLYSRIKHL